MFCARTLAVLASVLAGCATPALHVFPDSLHGIPEDRRVALPDEFLGEWRGATADVELERRSDESCHVVVRFGADEGPQELHLELTSVELAGQRILDVAPAEDEKLVDSAALVMPIHVFCRLQGDGQNVTLTFLDFEWLNGGSSLGDSSSDLIELLTAAAGDESAWEDECTLTRAP